MSISSEEISLGGVARPPSKRRRILSTEMILPNTDLPTVSPWTNCNLLSLPNDAIYHLFRVILTNGQLTTYSQIPPGYENAKSLAATCTRFNAIWNSFSIIHNLSKDNFSCGFHCTSCEGYVPSFLPLLMPLTTSTIKSVRLGRSCCPKLKFLLLDRLATHCPKLSAINMVAEEKSHVELLLPSLLKMKHLNHMTVGRPTRIYVTSMFHQVKSQLSSLHLYSIRRSVCPLISGLISSCRASNSSLRQFELSFKRRAPCFTRLISLRLVAKQYSSSRNGSHSVGCRGLPLKSPPIPISSYQKLLDYFSTLFFRGGGDTFVYFRIRPIYLHLQDTARQPYRSYPNVEDWEHEDIISTFTDLIPTASPQTDSSTQSTPSCNINVPATKKQIAVPSPGHGVQSTKGAHVSTEKVIVASNHKSTSETIETAAKKDFYFKKGHNNGTPTESAGEGRTELRERSSVQAPSITDSTIDEDTDNIYPNTKLRQIEVGLGLEGSELYNLSDFLGSVIRGIPKDMECHFGNFCFGGVLDALDESEGEDDEDKGDVAQGFRFSDEEIVPADIFDEVGDESDSNNGSNDSDRTNNEVEDAEDEDGGIVEEDNEIVDGGDNGGDDGGDNDGGDDGGDDGGGDDDDDDGDDGDDDDDDDDDDDEYDVIPRRRREPRHLDSARQDDKERLKIKQNIFDKALKRRESRFIDSKIVPHIHITFLSSSALMCPMHQALLKWPGLDLDGLKKFFIDGSLNPYLKKVVRPSLREEQFFYLRNIMSFVLLNENIRLESVVIQRFTMNNSLDLRRGIYVLETLMSSLAVTTVKSLTISLSYIGSLFSGIVKQNPNNPMANPHLLAMYLTTKILHKCSESLTTVRICVDGSGYGDSEADEIGECNQLVSYLILSIPSLLGVLGLKIPNLTEVDVHYEGKALKVSRTRRPIPLASDFAMCRAWRSLHVFGDQKPHIDTSSLSTLLFNLDNWREGYVLNETSA